MDADNPTPPAGVVPTAADYERAADEAGAAYGDGQPVTACPYPDGPLRVVWVRNYVAAQQRGGGRRIEPPGRADQ